MDVKESIRIVDVDSYMSHPVPGLDAMYSDFRGYSISQVPIIRVFGSTSQGKKVCTHVHGVFPYVYIPYDGKDDLNSLMYQIAANIDKALNISLKQASSNAQHVYKICRVSAYPFYGYHSKQHQFLKIYLYNPALIRRLSNLLQSDAILGKMYQPHESHLPFVLQFMIDYNLHGMSTMLVSDLKYRRNNDTIDLADENYLPPNITKISCCEVECDVLADDVINRLEVASGNLGVNPGIAALWEDERQRRRNKNEDSQIESCLSLKNVNVKPTDSHFTYRRALLDRLAILSTEKDIDKTPNLSVYPAETPLNETIQNASLVEFHSPLSDSFDSSLDVTISPSQDVDTTMNDTLDKNFLEILEELNEEQNRSVEEDSILSQTIKENEDEEDLDLSLPVQPSTPVKVVVKDDDDVSGSDDDMWNDSFNTTLVPQLDGCDDIAIGFQQQVNANVQPIQKPSSQLQKSGKSKAKGERNNNTLETIKTSIRTPIVDENSATATGKKKKEFLIQDEPIKLQESQSNVQSRKSKRIKEQFETNGAPFYGYYRKLIIKKEPTNNNDTFNCEAVNNCKPSSASKNLCAKVLPVIEQTCSLQSSTEIDKKMETVNQNKPIDPQPTRKPRRKCLHLSRKKCSKQKATNLKLAKKTKKFLDMPLLGPTQNNTIIEQPRSNKITLKVRLSRICEEIKRCRSVSNKEEKSNPPKPKKKMTKKTNPKRLKKLMLMRRIRQLEKNFDIAVMNGCVPKFIVKPAKRIYTLTNKIQVLSNIRLKSAPLDSLTVKICTASNGCFRYFYTNNIYPSVMRLKDCEHQNMKGSYIFSDVYLNTVIENDITKMIRKQTPVGLDLTVEFFKRKLESFAMFDKLDWFEIWKIQIPIDAKPLLEEMNEFLNRVENKENEVVATRKRDRPRKIAKLNQVDGAYDSISSDEEEAKVKRRRLSKRLNSPKYDSLPVSVVSSPRRSQRGTTSMEKHRLTVLKTFSTKKLKSLSQPTTSFNVKRQLDFCDTTLQSTIVEENLLCSYKPKKSTSKGKAIEQVESSSDSDSDANKSFFAHLTKAERYDIQSNFQPAQGTSNHITPGDVDSYDIFSSSADSTKRNDTIAKPSQCAPTLSQESLDQPAQRTIVLEDADSSDLFSSSAGSTKRNVPTGDSIATPTLSAPTRIQVLESLDQLNLPQVKHQEPFFSNVNDVTGGIEVGLALLKILSHTSLHLPEFETTLDTFNTVRKNYIGNIAGNVKWSRSNVNNHILSCVSNKNILVTPVRKPPSRKDIVNWILEKSKSVSTPEQKQPARKVKVFIPMSPGAENDNDSDVSMTLSPCTPTSSQKTTQSQTPKSSGSPSLGRAKLKKKILRSNQSISLRKSLLSQENVNHSCQLSGVTCNFDASVNNLQKGRAVLEHQFLTVMVMELHVRTRGDLKPNPEYDVVCAIFYSILNDVPSTEDKPSRGQGVIALTSLPIPREDNTPLLDGIGVDSQIHYVETEQDLIQELVQVIKTWDPDILAGYEIEMMSWGYLIERASVLGVNLHPLLGRILNPPQRTLNEGPQGELKITGRIVLDVWRLMRHEIALQSYTFESIVYHILHKRVPEYTFKDLRFWWDHKSHLYRHKTENYYLFRVNNILELFDKLDLIGRTSELARLFGILFYEVLSRGSQFRVESMMLRLAKPLNFVPVSPSVQQRAKMNAPEYIPLVLEPESKLYVDPVIVLDFQSLYPSIIIAYNYCFSTCIGKVERLGKNAPFEFGTTQLKISRRRLEKLVKADLVNYSPCGVGFVTSKVREGILPRMLKEILSTRLMVKNSMKENKEDSLLKKVLHNRQLGLKLIANVTYGYTSANFSGRMPAVEVGDSVVSKGRETLQRAIAMVDKTPEWGAKVVYGDTDSLFICFPGRTKDYAFEYGRKIADAISNDNPDPIKLKFEKVYYPCILQTKKRYVGYMYESPEQKEPVYEAKGIETVRRDGCPAVGKMLEKCLRLLFETKDVSVIKTYVLRQFNKIIAGRISMQDLTFAKEYRGASGYRPGACVPSLELARKWKAVDKRSEPRSGERVPYVIVNGAPGLPLIKLVRSPRDLIADPSLRPNALYYITKVIIPPINRCLTLIGADLNTWFNQMPRKHIQFLPTSSPGKKSTISQYFSTTSCASCGEQTKTGVCEACLAKPQDTTITLVEKIRKWEENDYEVNLICQSCTGSPSKTSCISLNCPVYYRRIQTSRDLQQATFVRQLMDEF